eukprot:Gb_12627 [translate_table: standard]
MKLRGMRFLLPFLLLTLFSAANGHNITRMLNSYPQFSVFNNYLSQTKLSDEINSRNTITVLAVDNASMTALTNRNLGLDTIKNVLSVHVLLDYFSAMKLHQITNGSALSTTLFQTTGMAQDQDGFMNITELNAGKVAFGSGEGSKLDALFVKSIEEVPYNISVLQISQLVIPSSLNSSQPAGNVNITSILLNGGHKTFAKLISDTGVLKAYEDALNGGLTVFAPRDEAFNGSVLEKINKFSPAQRVSILEFHAVPEYEPLATLKTRNEAMNTLATNRVSRYSLSVTTSRDTVILNTGINKAVVTTTLADDAPVAIFSIDKVLDPPEVFHVASPAPLSLAPSPSPAPSPPSAPTQNPITSPVAPPVSIPSPSSGRAPKFSPPVPPPSGLTPAPIDLHPQAPALQISPSGAAVRFNAGRGLLMLAGLVCGALMML